MERSAATFRQQLPRRRGRPARPVPPPLGKLSEMPLSAVLSHLEWTRLNLQGTAASKAAAGGEGSLRHMELILQRELDARQLRLFP